MIIELWPEGVPGLRSHAGPEKPLENGRICNIHYPSLTVFRPAPDRVNGASMIICPGGGYIRLAPDHEGVADWLNSLGVTVFVLKYRLVEYGHPAPLQDVLHAVRTVRARAEEFVLDPERVGLMGFSAGGHLAASAATLFDAPEGRTGSPLDSVSGRPDFAVLIYPVITMQLPHANATSRQALLGANPTDDLVRRYSLELQVTPATSPAFLVSTAEDNVVPLENSILYYQALRNVRVPAQLQLYEKGPHGFGFRLGYGPVSNWPAQCADWMRFHRWLP